MFYTSHILQALDYAIRNGAHIVSCSFGPRAILQPDASAQQREELLNETKLYSLSLAALKRKGMLMVASAGMYGVEGA